MPDIPVDPLDPALLDRPDVRAALAARDVGAVYRLSEKPVSLNARSRS
jgi:hypothetical protein